MLKVGVSNSVLNSFTEYPSSECSVMWLLLFLFFFCHYSNVLLMCFITVPVSLDPPAAPSIHLNSVHLSNQTEIVLTAGSTFSLSCHGNSPTHWSSTAFLLLNKKELANPLRVNISVSKHTGTYRCGYTSEGLNHLDSWIHLFIKGKTFTPTPTSC